MDGVCIFPKELAFLDQDGELAQGPRRRRADCGGAVRLEDSQEAGYDGAVLVLPQPLEGFFQDEFVVIPEAHLEDGAEVQLGAVFGQLNHGGNGPLPPFTGHGEPGPGEYAKFRRGKVGNLDELAGGHFFQWICHSLDKFF